MKNNEMNELGPLIKAANTLIEKELNNAMRNLFTELNLTGTQVAILTYLYETKGRTVYQKELETIFALSHPTIRSIVKRLEERQLIDISTLKSDKRQVILTLSAKGTVLINDNLATIYQIMSQINQKITAGLTLNEQHNFNNYLRKLIRNLKV